MTDQVIHCSVHLKATNNMWLCSFVYGFNQLKDTKSLWRTLCNIHDRVDMPWLICGDFNNVLNFDERVGAPVTASEIRDFKECVGYYHLSDLKQKGCFFTWNNKKDGGDIVFTKIDIVLSNDEWDVMYP